MWDKNTSDDANMPLLLAFASSFCTLKCNAEPGELPSKFTKKSHTYGADYVIQKSLY